ncbi:17047_t:CDS:1, partial [Gigaspora margarita]
MNFSNNAYLRGLNGLGWVGFEPDLGLEIGTLLKLEVTTLV